MKAQHLIATWFKTWEGGNIENLPITDDFTHTSPFGTIIGKKAYLTLVNANKDKFLGYSFTIHDELYENNKACVRYTTKQGDFKLDVSEWYTINDNLIQEIIAYYHIGEIREDRQLT
jgi:hypothetical protein